MEILSNSIWWIGGAVFGIGLLALLAPNWFKRRERGQRLRLHPKPFFSVAAIADSGDGEFRILIKSAFGDAEIRGLNAQTAAQFHVGEEYLVEITRVD